MPWVSKETVFKWKRRIKKDLKKQKLILKLTKIINLNINGCCSAFVWKISKKWQNLAILGSQASLVKTLSCRISEKLVEIPIWVLVKRITSQNLLEDSLCLLKKTRTVW